MAQKSANAGYHKGAHQRLFVNKSSYTALSLVMTGCERTHSKRVADNGPRRFDLGPGQVTKNSNNRLPMKKQESQNR